MSAAMLSFVPSPVDPARLVAPSYSAPLVLNDAAITANGSNVFEGNWRNDSFSSNSGAAILLMTNQPVTIRNSRIVSQKYGIHGNETTGRNLTVENCLIMTRNDVQAAEAALYGIRLWEPASAVIERNTFVGAGISIGGATNYINPTTTARVKFNRCTNVNGLFSDGSGGYRFELASTPNVYFAQRQFLQFNYLSVPGSNCEVAWNEIVNSPFVSRAEDCINMHGARGAVGFPMLVHDNYVQGSWPSRPYDLGMSGSGIVCEADARYIDVADNQIISCGNAAIGIVNAANCRALRNRAVGDGRVMGRTQFNRREAFLFYNATPTPATTNCSFEDNLHAWRGPGGALDAAYAPVAGSDGNVMSGNTSLGTPDEAMEAAEWALWVAKKASAGVICGSTLVL